MQGDLLVLRRDFSNLHDDNAIVVAKDSSEIGFIPREVAQVIAPYIDTGSQVEAVVDRVIREIPEVTIKIKIS